jgi:hypothetical protein
MGVSPIVSWKSGNHRSEPDVPLSSRSTVPECPSLIARGSCAAPNAARGIRISRHQEAPIRQESTTAQPDAFHASLRAATGARQAAPARLRPARHCDFGRAQDHCALTELGWANQLSGGSTPRARRLSTHQGSRGVLRARPPQVRRFVHGSWAKQVTAQLHSRLWRA